MSLPIPANVRFAISRGGTSVAIGVPGHLEGAYDEGLERAESDPAFRYTHLLLVEASVDLRDDFETFSAVGGRDVVFVPDADGTAYEVVYVERPFRGVGPAVKRVYLNRRLPPVPVGVE